MTVSANFRRGVHIFLGRVPRLYHVLKGTNDTRSVIAIALAHVFLALPLTLVSAHPAGG